MFMRHVVYQTKEDLIYALLNEIGLKIIDGCLYDQDSNSKLSMEGRNIICSLDPNIQLYASEFNRVFNPFRDFMLMQMLLSFYFKKEEAMEGIYVISFNPIETTKYGPVSYRVTIQEDGVITNLEGKAYNSRALAISDIILRMSGVDPDLSNFDELSYEERKRIWEKTNPGEPFRIQQEKF